MPRWGFCAVPLVLCLCCRFSSASSAGDFGSVRSKNQTSQILAVRTSRTSSLDLELSGDLIGVPAGHHRFLTREDLLALPQVTYTVNEDANFTKPTQISGVLLEELNQRLSAKPLTDMVIAICSDLYQANYPRAYLAAHKPVLVLLVDGKPPADWPQASERHHGYMGPFMISHANFTPSFQVLGNSEEAQIPWGVVRLDFRDEQETFAGIAPRGQQANSAEVQAGFRIAQQQCLHCHSQGKGGVQKAGSPWGVLATWATASPQYFASYVRDPRSKNPHAQMPGNPNYDDATLQALIVYFRNFSRGGTP